MHSPPHPLFDAFTSKRNENRIAENGETLILHFRGRKTHFNLFIDRNCISYTRKISIEYKKQHKNNRIKNRELG